MHADLGIFRKTLHIIPVIPVYLIICTVIYAFTQNYTFDNNSSLFKTFILILFYFSATMVIICHTFAMFADPGIVKIQPNDYEKSNLTTSNSHNHALYCKKCPGSRPDRSHHCKVCKKCIMKMDHHCPWIGNCVGLWNIKYFYLFLFYATLGDLIAAVLLYFKFKQTDISDKFKNQTASTIYELIFIFKEQIILLIGIMLAIAMTVSIGFLFYLQTKNLINDTTTLELICEFQNKLGNNRKKFENFKYIMGDKIYKWFLPIQSADILMLKSQNKLNSNEVRKSADSNENNYISLTDNVHEFDENIQINLNLSD